MTDRLDEIVRQGYADYHKGTNPRRGMAETIADALRAAGATVPEPPKGPVTSEATATKWLHGPSQPHLAAVEAARWDLDDLIPDLAKDHGLLTREEVERRVNAWWEGIPSDRASLLAALTRREG